MRAAAIGLVMALAACEAAPPQSEAREAAGVPAASVETIDAASLAKMLESGNVQLIDVRTPEEFAEGHIAGALNIPVDEFDPAKLPETNGEETILYCRSDRRSGIAAERLAEATGESAVHLDGGILAWEAAGQPVTE